MEPENQPEVHRDELIMQQQRQIEKEVNNPSYIYYIYVFVEHLVYENNIIIL